MSSCDSLVVEALTENSILKLRSAGSCIRSGTYQRTQLVSTLVKCNKKGETPLVIAMRKKHYDVVDELMIILKIFCLSVPKCQPLCSLAIEQLISYQIPIVELLDHLTEETQNYMWLKFISDSCIKSSSITKEEKIIVLELIGAIFFIGSSCDSYISSKRGLGLWKEAMALREDVDSPLPKVTELGSHSAVSRKVFGSAVEFTSAEQVVHLEQQLVLSLPNQIEYQIRLEILQVQALLVLRRICTQFSHGQSSPYWIYSRNLLTYGCQCQRLHNYNLAINVGLLVLEHMTDEFDPKMTFPKLMEVYARTLNLLSVCFKEMLKEPPCSSRREELSAANVLVAIKFCTTISNYFPKTKIIVANLGEIHYNVVHIYNFVSILGAISHQTSIQEQKQLEEYLAKYIRHGIQDGKSTILHAAVRPVKEELNLNTIKLLLNLGADPNATNENGETPLHYLAGMFKLHLKFFLSAFQALVDAGGHLDMARSDGKTVVSILKVTLKLYENSSLMAEPYFDSLVKSVFPLSCYCARIIRQHGIQYDEDRLPSTVQTFVSRHSTRGLVD